MQLKEKKKKKGGQKQKKLVTDLWIYVYGHLSTWQFNLQSSQTTSRHGFKVM